MQRLFQHNDFHYVIHLAAQAGVRYSLTHPMPYIQTNIVGFMNILECARYLKNLKNMAYASSSSVYGENKKQPFSEDDRVDNPMSLYAATKRADELIAQSYHHLYKMPLTGLRFFTVYGPWGRPDMAAYSFTRSIFEKQPIDVYNYGKMERDYTYVADTVIGILRSLTRTIDVSKQNHEIYNLGNNATEPLDRFISILENNCGTKAIKNLLPIQPGDVPSTCARIGKAQEDFGYQPKIRIDEGLKYFVSWYKGYHNKT
jgi:UDP-glucuronate 4-epimerase